ncbi:MAG TPA: HhH-GPD-type base excision DNA repair protein [Acidimicrobiales bacterium]|nr:HhH-GPD-type base excision DNA repair protein [Acidimicrobiales bacterium]
MASAHLRLSQDPEADRLLSDSPLALLVGMVLDQQVPLEWAFASPLELTRRLGRKLDAKDLASMDPTALAAVFSERPALHRYPGSMAQRVHDLAGALVAEYGGRADNVWKAVQSGEELFTRIRSLPGFGEQKARIFVALLGKQLGVQPEGWQAVSAPYSDAGTFRSVADIVDEQSLAKVRDFKAQMKAAAKKAGAATTKAGAGTTKAGAAAKTHTATTTKSGAAAPKKTGAGAAKKNGAGAAKKTGSGATKKTAGRGARTGKAASAR